MPDYSRLVAKALAAAGLSSAATVAAPDEAQATFIGNLARTFNRKAAEQATAQARAGVNADVVHQLTGMSRPPGPYQTWRQEIPDLNARFRFDPAYVPHLTDETVAFANATPVQNWFRHPALFRAYPELTNAKVMSFDPANIPGTAAFVQHSPEGRMLFGISRAMPTDEARSSMLHEMAHAIQHIQGWPRGANLDSPWVLKTAAQEMGIPVEQATVDRLSSTPAGRKALELAYWRTAGEAEARNVQARADMSAEQMQRLPPWMTADVPYAQQIIAPPRPYQMPLPLPFDPPRLPFKAMDPWNR
jgi:hypothetical protein